MQLTLALLLFLQLFSERGIAADALAPSDTAAAELHFERGMQLARQNQWDEARTALETGQKLAPFDKRFPLELAGIAFKAKDLSASKKYLHRALSLDVQNSYGNEFLGTIYFLEGNVESSLKYWNRLGRPRIEEVKSDGQFQLKPALLDRALTFAPAEVLHRRDFVTSNLRLEQLDIFPHHQFVLAARTDGNFDLVFRGIERNGWGASKLDGLLSTFRGIFYQTIYTELYNLRGSGMNSLSFWRWDQDKQRLFSSLSGPPGGDPAWRYRLLLDLRSEDWELQTFAADAGLESFRAGCELEKVVNDRMNWKTGAEVSKRNFIGSVRPDDPLFAEGTFLRYATELHYQVLRNSDRRLTVQSGISANVGRELSGSSSLFSKMEFDLDAIWFPQLRGPDGRMRARFRSGVTMGPVPVDELYSIGVDRDHDLWLRAHSGLGEKKGSNPLGRDYVLINLEADKILYNHTFFRLAVTPFIDLGRVSGGIETMDSRIWLIDTGLQTKVRFIGGITAIVTYGKALRSGEGTIYFNVIR